MRFTLVDQIVELEPGSKIKTIKNLSLAEEYLVDHFPGFPVLPGVLMLEAMTQSAAWLIRVTDDFADSIVTLKEARNVKYGSFVKPGDCLEITASITKFTEDEIKVKAEGTVDGKSTVSARLVLEKYNLADHDPSRKTTDDLVVTKMKELYKILDKT